MELKEVKTRYCPIAGSLCSKHGVSNDPSALEAEAEKNRTNRCVFWQNHGQTCLLELAAKKIVRDMNVRDD